MAFRACSSRVSIRTRVCFAGTSAFVIRAPRLAVSTRSGPGTGWCHRRRNAARGGVRSIGWSRRRALTRTLILGRKNCRVAVLRAREVPRIPAFAPVSIVPRRSYIMQEDREQSRDNAQPDRSMSATSDAANRAQQDAARADPQRRDSGEPGRGAGPSDVPGETGVYPLSAGIAPKQNAEIRTEAKWGQGDRGAKAMKDQEGAELVMRNGELLGGLTSGPSGEPTIDIHGRDRPPSSHSRLGESPCESTNHSTASRRCRGRHRVRAVELVVPRRVVAGVLEHGHEPAAATSIGRSYPACRARCKCAARRLGAPGAMKPGENAITCVNRSAVVSPSESAYDAPSENPPTANRCGSIAQRSNVASSASLMNSTSGPNPPRITSHVCPRDAGASTTSPPHRQCSRERGRRAAPCRRRRAASRQAAKGASRRNSAARTGARRARAESEGIEPGSGSSARASPVER